MKTLRYLQLSRTAVIIAQPFRYSFYDVMAWFMVVIRQWRTQEFCSWGVQQIQLGTEDIEKGHLGAVAP